MDVYRAVQRFSLVLLILVVPVGVACLFMPKCNNQRALQQKKAGLEEDTRRIEAMTSEVRARQERFRSDPAFVERTAREAGMVKTNEVIFKLGSDSVTAVDTNREAPREHARPVQGRIRSGSRRAG